MTAELHQGYTNYATFGVGIVFATDRASYDLARGMAAEYPDDGELAHAIQEMVTGWAAIDDASAGAATELEGLVRSALVQAGLAEVDWFDLARHFRPED